MIGALVLAAVVSLTNREVVVGFDTAGCVSSVVERATGRDLAGKSRVPFVSIGTKFHGWVNPTSVVLEDKGRRMAFSFPDPVGRMVLDIEPFAGGWTFAVSQFPVDAATEAQLGCVAFADALSTYLGERSNAASDDRSAISVRSYDLHARMFIGRTRLGTQIPAGRALIQKGKASIHRVPKRFLILLHSTIPPVRLSASSLHFSADN